MTPLTFWLGRVTAAFFAVAVVVAGIALVGTRDGLGRKALRGYVAALDQKLRFLRWRTQGAHWAFGQLSLSVVASAVAIASDRWSVLLALPAIVFGPKVLIERQASRRIARIEAQVESWVGAIANALKASPSLGEAIASTISLIQSPLSEEVDVLVKEYGLGTPLDEGLENLARRVGSHTLSGTVLALKVARRSGGNLPEMLENAAIALRELARLEGVVRTKTAEGKAQAFVIGLIPVPMVVGIHTMDEHFFDPLAKTFLGNLIVAGAATLWAIAILLSRKILSVDV